MPLKMPEKMPSRNQRGDTIVEVLLSIAVVSMVIGISFSVANRSVLTGRDAQERTEALQIAQSQIERVRALAVLPSPTAVQNMFPPMYTDFCLDGSLNQFTVTNPNCKAQGLGNLYDIDVHYASANDTFTATTNWQGLKGPASVSIIYRIHKP